MKYKIIPYVIVTILLLNFVSAEKYYELNVKHILDSVTFNGITVKEIDRPVRNTQTSGYIIKTISIDNKELDSIYFEMSENKEYLIYVPYKENAAKIEVYNIKGSKIMDLDVTSFSNTCGNNICEPYESYESCTKDCSSGSRDDFCDGINDGICDPDCISKTDPDCKGSTQDKTIAPSDSTPIQASKKTLVETAEIEESSNQGILSKLFSDYMIYIIIISIFIILILVFVFVKYRKQSQIISTLTRYINECQRRGYTMQQIQDALFRQGYSQKEVEKAIRSVQ